MIEKLLEFEEIDGVMIGPYDMSGSLGIPGKINHKKVQNAVNKVVKQCEKFGKSCGIHEVEPTMESVKGVLNSGLNFIVLASDVFILWKWAVRMKKLIKNYR